MINRLSWMAAGAVVAYALLLKTVGIGLDVEIRRRLSRARGLGDRIQQLPAVHSREVLTGVKHAG